LKNIELTEASVDDRKFAFLDIAEQITIFRKQVSKHRLL